MTQLQLRVWSSCEGEVDVVGFKIIGSREAEFYVENNNQLLYYNIKQVKIACSTV